MKTAFQILLLILFLIFLGGCTLFVDDEYDEPREILVRDNYVTIEWDNPIYLIKSGEAESQMIYIRAHGTENWQLMDEVDFSIVPSYTIRRADLKPGKYDFGVSVKTKDGKISKIHSSLDTSASPATGWYIFWIMD